MDYKKEFVKVAEKDYSNRHLSEVLRDFTELSKCSIANTVYKSDCIEEQWVNISKTYKSTSGFSQMLVIVVEALETNPNQDFLGDVYMEAEVSNSRAGQFFTPYALSKVCASLTFNKEDVDAVIASRGFTTINEPACGCGSMVIAWRNVLADNGYGSFDCLFHAADLDRFCYGATYVQLSLLGCCGLISHANTLSGEIFESLYTPLTFMSPKFAAILKT
jgi:type I restriction-modification system DNA methylase subunit